MSKGLTTTFDVLTKTGNEAAVRVLVPALDSPQRAIRVGALEAILSRRSLPGHREVIRRLQTLSEDDRELVGKHRTRLSRAVRAAVLDTDSQMCLNGCRAAVWFREYDLVPVLLGALEDRSNENADMASAALSELVQLLYQSLKMPRDYSDRRDPQRAREHVLDGLEQSVKRFDDHKRREVLESFLLLVDRDNPTLRSLLANPHTPVFRAIMDMLLHATQGGIIRLLLNFLDDAHMPRAVLTGISKRTDVKFVRHLLRKIGREPASALKQNLRRITSIAWLPGDGSFLDLLDDAAQHGTVRLVASSGVPRPDAFATIEYLLLHGKPGGRREAAKALADFRGADANALALKALDDSDPQVQANILVQVRRRGILGILPRLVQMVDSPHAVVRKAARSGLEEFTFGRFLGAFDMLDDDVRYSTGKLVLKVDPQALPLLRGELESRARTRRLRGLEIAEVLDVVERLEQPIIELLGDEDHLVRVAAASALVHSASITSQQALQKSLEDSSKAVRDAARRTLEERSRLGLLPGVGLGVSR